ncbi:MAG: hypothetical protein ACRDGT_08750 [Candidatus Limnocylindria bacterium]
MRRIAERASDDDLGRPIDEGWTVATSFAHIAFWDRITSARWKAILAGESLQDTLRFPPGAIDWTNEAASPQWSALPRRAAAEDALRAAEELDHLIERLPAWAIEQAKAHDRPGMFDRTRHRGQHLDRIEQVLGPPG